VRAGKAENSSPDSRLFSKSILRFGLLLPGDRPKCGRSKIKRRNDWFVSQKNLFSMTFQSESLSFRRETSAFDEFRNLVSASDSYSPVFIPFITISMISNFRTLSDRKEIESIDGGPVGEVFDNEKNFTIEYHFRQRGTRSIMLEHRDRMVLRTTFLTPKRSNEYLNLIS
jgi:hypothetical protein